MIIAELGPGLSGVELNIGNRSQHPVSYPPRPCDCHKPKLPVAIERVAKLGDQYLRMRPTSLP